MVRAASGRATGATSVGVAAPLQEVAMALELFIDVDTHITEPPDTWSARVPAKYRDSVPYTQRNARGLDHWYLNGEPSPRSA